METNKQTKKATSKEKVPNVYAKGLSFFFSFFFAQSCLVNVVVVVLRFATLLQPKFLFFCASARIVMAPNVYAKGEKKSINVLFFFEFRPKAVW